MTKHDGIDPKALFVGAILVGGLVGLAAAGEPDAAAERELSQTCVECHDEQAASLDQGPHTLALAAGEGFASRVSCVSCHEGEKGHWEDDPESYPMSVPGTQGMDATARVCSQCHDNAHQTNQATLSAHAANDLTCLSCHQIHAAPFDKQLRQRQPELCFQCHGELRGKFAMPSQHPAGEQGFMKCTDCHLAVDDRLADLSLRGRNEACFQCHGELRGPFPHEHQATLDYSTAEGGCLTCHDPHGSYEPVLLKQPYEPPHFQLCTQCHAVPRHNYNNQHGSDFSGVACAECHTDVHGSYTSRLFLSPTLEAQGCFSVGCHSR